MPRFQSRLFNWIDQSLPAQLGRSARKFLDQKINQLAGLEIQELPRLLGYQVAKAALYPVYLLVSTTRRVFPSLRPSSRAEWEQIAQGRSPKDEILGLLADSTNLDIEKESSSPEDSEDSNALDLSEIPVILRPLAKFLNWLDLTKTKLDRNIAAIVKRQNDSLVSTSQGTEADSELTTKVLANRVFAAIWQEQVAQRQAQNSQGENPPKDLKEALKESNTLAEVTALGRNSNLEKLKRLIEAAIDYFFGDQDHQELTNDDAEFSLGSQDDASFSPLNGQVANATLPDRQSPKSQKFKSTANRGQLPSDRRLAKPSQSSQLNSETSTKGGNLRENSPLAEGSRWHRLRELIVAAIDYFIGRRSLGGDQQYGDRQNGDRQNSEAISNSDPELEKFQTGLAETGLKGFINYIKTGQNQPIAPEISMSSQQVSPANQASTANQVNQSYDTLKFDDQLARWQRLRQIIEAAIEYFFQKKRSPSLDATTDIEPSDSAWLTMEDVFGDDHGPWPMPVEYESIAFTQTAKYNSVHSSGDLQNFETTTTQISQDRLDGSLVFDEYEQDILANSTASADPEHDRPLRAWIEAKANLVGRRYSPVMVVVFWLDQVILKVENLAIALWQGIVNFPKRLINFIRYGKF